MTYGGRYIFEVSRLFTVRLSTSKAQMSLSDKIEEILGGNFTEELGVLLLEQCNAKIEESRSQLTLQRTLKGVIEGKLVSIRSQTAPIRRLPQEILIQVFAELVKTTPTAIGSILLVCRKWNVLACNSPLLWTTIPSILQPDVEAIRTLTRFVESAVRYSRGAPLDVQLRLPDLFGFWREQAFCLEPADPYYGQDPDEPVSCRKIASWLFDASMNSSSNNDFPPYSQIEYAISEHILAITGKKGENVSRFRSFDFRCEGGLFGKWVIDGVSDLLCQSTPLLEDLTVLIDPETGFADIGQVFVEPAPRLRRLTWNAGWPFDSLLTEDGQLTHLHMALSRYSIGCFPPSRFTYNLRVLHLDCPHLPNQGPEMQDSTFPFLEELIIHGKYPIDLITAPKLTTLRLVSFECGEMFLSDALRFPSLKTLHIWALPERLGDVDSCIKQIPALTEVAFLHREKDPVIKCAIFCIKQLSSINQIDRTVVKGFCYNSLGLAPWVFNQYNHREISPEDFV